MSLPEHVQRAGGEPSARRGDWSTESRDGMHEFLRVLRRRKLALLLPIILTPLFALAHSSFQDPVYSASADVLVTSGSVVSALSDLPGLSSDQPERNARTQVGLARLPRVAQRVIDAAPLSEDADTFLGRSSVSASPDSDILRFTVEDGAARESVRLATLYAREFTEYRNALDVQAIQRTRSTIARTMAKLAAAGERGSPVYAELRAAIRQLEAAEAVQGSAAILVQPAVSAAQIAPRTMRDLVLALALGVLLGIGMAFLVERLDTRVRDTDEIEGIMRLPVLGEIPPPPALPRESKTDVTMVEFAFGPYAESVRKLRANLDFANLGVGATTVMISSAVDGEGKTTTASDLAVALARSGRRVALCDLDARAPNVDRLFGLIGRRGLVDVAFGVESLDRALVPISWTTPTRLALRSMDPALAEGDLGYLASPSDGGTPGGQLNVLPFGKQKPPSPADFVGSKAVRQIVGRLGESHDIVILDSPPLVPVSDSVTISEYVDAVILVCGLKTSRRPTLENLRKLAALLPTRVLGMVVTGAAALQGYGAYSHDGHVAVQSPGRPTAESASR